MILIGMVTLTSSSLLIPLLARISPSLLIGVRVLQGLASGLSFPGVYNLCTIWTHRKERATLMSVTFSALYAANVTTSPLTSWLCNSGIDGGWPMAFYVPGTTGAIWCILFYVLIYSRPEDHPRISMEELKYLVGNEPIVKGKEQVVKDTLTVPWLEMAKSTAVHALWITHLCSYFCVYLILINLSLFIREALGFNILDNGMLSMLPSLGSLIFNSAGPLFDNLRSKSLCSVSVLRKTFNSVGFFVPAICFIVLRLVPCQMKVAHVVILAIGLSIHRISLTGGYYFSHSELAGPYSGVLFGVTNTFAQIPGFITPLLVSTMTPNGNLQEWYNVFTLGGCVYIFGGLVYLFFGKCERQPWAKENEVLEEEREVNHSNILNKKSESFQIEIINRINESPFVVNTESRSV